MLPLLAPCGLQPWWPTSLSPALRPCGLPPWAPWLDPHASSPVSLLASPAITHHAPQPTQAIGQGARLLLYCTLTYLLSTYLLTYCPSRRRQADLPEGALTMNDWYLDNIDSLEDVRAFLLFLPFIGVMIIFSFLQLSRTGQASLCTSPFL